MYLTHTLPLPPLFLAVKVIFTKMKQFYEEVILAILLI